MNVTLCSAFRNATPYLNRYLAQVAGLYEALGAQGHALRCVWGEGDSTDNTREVLASARTMWQTTIVDCTHGGPVYGSIESWQRFKQLSHVGNVIWAAIPKDTDAVLYVESDLIWEPATLVNLLEALTIYPAVVPMIMDSPPAETFYDVWAFRRNGIRFTKRFPFHADFWPQSALQLDSAGSCIAIRWKLGQWLSFPEDCFVGFCRLLHEQGGELYLCPELAVYHP